MHSTRRSLVLVVAAAACLVVSASVTAVAATGRHLLGLAAAYVLDGLSLFSDPKPKVQSQPEVRTGLTARERHDLHAAPNFRPTVMERWRMCPSA